MPPSDEAACFLAECSWAFARVDIDLDFAAVNCVVRPHADFPNALAIRMLILLHRADFAHPCPVLPE